jgi:hypothetical protein
MKGLAPEEKALFQRIGNLVDVLSFSQRQENNPGLARSRKNSPKIPKPQNATATGVAGGVEFKWDAVDFNVRADGLAFYEVQFSESISFADLDVIESVGTRVIIKTNPASGTLFLRVRTVSKRGLVSDFTTTSSVSTAGEIFTADQDDIEPENRTSVLPHPFLLGTPLENNAGSIFSGFGAHVGPSPFTLDDDNTGLSGSGNINIRNDITFTLLENDDPFPGIQSEHLDTIGQQYLEESPFYVFDPSFYIRPQTLTGSLTDFFDVITLLSNPIQTDIEFLRYRILNDFYVPDHPQNGYVLNASMSTIKF